MTEESDGMAVEIKYPGLETGGFAIQTTERVRYKGRIFDVKVGSAMPPRFEEPEYWWDVDELDPETEEPLMITDEGVISIACTPRFTSMEAAKDAALQALISEVDAQSQ